VHCLVCREPQALVVDAYDDAFFVGASVHQERSAQITELLRVAE
jgi:hypothetical protein